MGAVVVKKGKVIASAHNLKETSHDPTAHAEILAIRQAAQVLETWYLNDTILYVTLEPCPMCAWAILQARIPTLVFGAMDAKAGAAGTVVNIVDDKKFNHRAEVIAGIMEKECKEILQRFFTLKR